MKKSGGIYCGIMALGLLLVNVGPAAADYTQMLHNSANLGTKYGSWGGSVTCTSCHGPTRNIKLANYSVTTPTGKRPVVFNQLSSSIDVIGLLGDDLRASFPDAARNICAVCHHKTTHHQYSATKIVNRATETHKNRQDCTRCHSHRNGFKSPACDSCHGNPPATAGGLLSPSTGATSPASPGAHAQHATTLRMTCNACHNGSTMLTSSNSVQIGFAINGGNWPGFRGSFAYGSFSGHAPLSASYGPITASSGGTLVNGSSSYRNSCNVYCHGQWPGSNGSINPSWVITDGSQKTCGTCHATTQSNPPTAGSHLRHTGTAADQQNLACTECHGTQPTNNSHINGLAVTRLNTASSKFGPGATYKGFANQSSAALNYGSCASVYCHGSASTPKWGTAPLSCNGCHSARANDTYWAGNSAHKLHWEGSDLPTSYAMAPGNTTGDATTYRFTCSSCHSPGKGAVHVNGKADPKGAAQVYFGFTSATRKGSYSYGTTQGSTDNGFGWTDAAGAGCNTTYCHSDGADGNGDPVGWLRTTNSDTLTQARCIICHGFYGVGKQITTGHHQSHIGAYSCATCHYGTSTDGQQVTNKVNHANKKAEIVFNPLNPESATGTYNELAKTCANVSCHFHRGISW